MVSSKTWIHICIGVHEQDVLVVWIGSNSTHFIWNLLWNHWNHWNVLVEPLESLECVAITTGIIGMCWS